MAAAIRDDTAAPGLVREGAVMGAYLLVFTALVILAAGIRFLTSRRTGSK